MVDLSLISLLFVSNIIAAKIRFRKKSRFASGK